MLLLLKADNTVKQHGEACIPHQCIRPQSIPVNHSRPRDLQTALQCTKSLHMRLPWFLFPLLEISQNAATHASRRQLCCRCLASRRADNWQCLSDGYPWDPTVVDRSPPPDASSSTTSTLRRRYSAVSDIPSVSTLEQCGAWLLRVTL